uniref:Dna repair protein rad51-like protein 4 n=1 Tax=Triatoma infestans TaxID=30076 RepID=A0A161MD99_TRIIF
MGKFVDEVIIHMCTNVFIYRLDELLNGGLLTGTILEMCGMSGSGKTQICLTITLNIVLEMKSNVTYIDTKRDLCSSRFLQILHTRTYKEESLVLENKKFEKH